jgi:opacity protein-like surface antigen
MRRLILGAAFLLVIAWPGLAGAEGYAAVKFGGYLPQEGLLEDADTGFGIELGLGYRFLGTVGCEVEIGGFQTQVPAYVMGAKVDTNFVVVPITVNIVLGKQFGAMRPYLKGGIGYYYAEYEKTFGGQEGGSATGYQVGVGISIQRFLIEYKYISAEPEINGNVFDVSGSIVSVGYEF